jgi:Immunity protein 61
MAEGVSISGELEDWAARAGYSLTPTDENGRAVFWTSDGELCHFIEKSHQKYFRVTRSNRKGGAQFELAAQSMTTIERYLYGLFGADLRYRNRRRQATPDQRWRDGGFETRTFPQTDPDFFALFQTPDHERLALYSGEDVIAVDGFGKIMAETRLNELAVYLSVSTDEIRASFERADGGDLLIVRDDDEGEGTPAPA